MVIPFAFDNYRKYLNERLAAGPRKGFGQMSQLARFLGVHTTLVSQILKGRKNLTTDQAVQTSVFLGLNEDATEYFVLLVQLDRAGNSDAKKFFKKQLSRLKVQAQDISRRVTVEARLTDEQRAIFYSNWAYTAVRQSVAINGLRDVESISNYLGLSRRKVQNFLDFLIESDLCKLSRGELSVGPTSTHIEAGSPWVRVHHVNWRARAIQSLDSDQPGDVHYTSPLTLSLTDADVVHEMLVQFIEQVNKIVDPSPSEGLFCLNLDWFRVGN